MRLLEAVYEHLRAFIRVDADRSEPFNYRIGVRQGYPASSILSNLHINDMMDGLSGIRIGDVTISGLLFAVDAVILAGSEGRVGTD